MKYLVTVLLLAGAITAGYFSVAGPEEPDPVPDIREETVQKVTEPEPLPEKKN